MATGNNSSFNQAFDSSKPNLSEIKYTNMICDSNNMYVLPTVQNYYIYPNSYIGKKRDDTEVSMYLQNQLTSPNNKGMSLFSIFFIFYFLMFLKNYVCLNIFYIDIYITFFRTNQMLPLLHHLPRQNGNLSKLL